MRLKHDAHRGDVFISRAGKVASLQGKAGALPLPLKLAHLQTELAAERTAVAGLCLSEKYAKASDELKAAQVEYQVKSQEAGELRKARDRLSAASESATRLRVAQELLEELRAQVRAAGRSRGQMRDNMPCLLPAWPRESQAS